MRTWVRSVLPVAIAVMTFGTAQAATAATCSPGAPVCTEIRGTPGAQYFWFRFQPAPQPAAFTLTLNGVPASGSATSRIAGSALEGEFRPSAGLVSGDEVCVRAAGGTQDHCATTP